MEEQEQYTHDLGDQPIAVQIANSKNKHHVHWNLFAQTADWTAMDNKFICKCSVCLWVIHTQEKNAKCVR